MSTASRWRVDAITVRSFRGIDREQTFELAGKPALFCGNNGVGKSTIALALQWTLFGKFPDGVLANKGFKQFLPPVATKNAGPYGEVVFRCGAQRLIIRRDEEKATFRIKIGSDAWEDEDAEVQRDSILGVDMDSFVRTVLLHQTRTRGLLLDDAKSRNHAIDMLLGVEVAQNLYEILKPKRFLDAAELWRTEIEEEQREHEAQYKILEQQLDAATKSAREVGFVSKDFKWQALAARYRSLGLEVAQLAEKQDVSVVAPQGPDSLKEAGSFSSKVRKALLQIPIKASAQSRLTLERTHLGRLETLLKLFCDAIEQRDVVGKAIQSAEGEHGKGVDLPLQRKRLSNSVTQLSEELKGLNELHGILADAQSYVAQHGSKSCPVCEQQVDANQLSTALDRRIDALKSHEIRAKEKEIKSAQVKLRECENAENELSRLARQLASCQKDVNQFISQIAAALDLDTLAESKVQQRLGAAIAKSKADCKRLEGQAESLLEQIESLNSELTNLSAGLLPVLEKRAELEAYESAAKDSVKKHQKAAEHGDDMEALGARIERIQKALLASKERLASEGLKRAKPRALSIYKRLVRHPRFSTFEITATPMAKKVEYNFVVSVDGKNGTEREARLLLSDGQLTATAIGVFIGLAESAGHALDLLFIDDPTQNIDLPCKEAMAKLMTEIAQQKQLVLSTHDDGFIAHLEEQGFHRHAAVFTLEKWNGNPIVMRR